MIAELAVGGPRSPLPAGSWDLWPLAGALIALWIGRRFVGLPWKAPLAIFVATGALVLPPVVDAWGVSVAALLTSGVAALAVAIRSTARGRDTTV